MDYQIDIKSLLGQEEGINLEYKSVLPPSKTLAKIIAGFSNSEGGYIILGVSENKSGIEIIGLSEDFYATSITNKALESLTPKPSVGFNYVEYSGKKLFVIKIQKSNEAVLLENKKFIRSGANTEESNPKPLLFRSGGYDRIQSINQYINSALIISTSSKNSLFEHYQSILKIMDDLGPILYPTDPQELTDNTEGKILNRILFSSFVDSFETYLSDLLYEIFLAIPATLKSKQEVTIEEVLNCSDLQEFIKYWAKQKISKLQKGSVTGFLEDTKQIRNLNVINKGQQEEIEKILQIRHLYTHRNGIVDEKFIAHFTAGYSINSEHKMSTSEICDKMEYLLKRVDEIDRAAIQKYGLATLS